MSNHAYHRTVSRLPWGQGGPRHKRPHQRTLRAAERFQAEQLARMRAAVEAMIEEEGDYAPEGDNISVEVIRQDPPVVWGYGQGPKARARA